MMDAFLAITIALLLIAFLEVKYRDLDSQKDTQTRKGDEDDAS